MSAILATARTLLAMPSVRRALLMCAVTLALSAAAVGVAARWAAERHALALAAAAKRDAARARLAESESLDWERRLGTYRALRSRGAFAPADPVAWIEALTAACVRLRLPQPSFELGPRVAAAAESEPDHYDLRFKISGVHESELLALLEAVQSGIAHAVRPQRCDLSRLADDMGLAVDCELRIFVFDASPSSRTEEPAQ